MIVGDALRSRIRQVECDHRNEPEVVVARILYDLMSEAEREVALLEAISDQVWDIRRGYQLAIERRSTSVASAAPKPRTPVQIEADRRRLRESKEIGENAIKLAEERKEIAERHQQARRDQERAEMRILLDEVGPRCRQWMADPSTFPGDLLVVLGETERASSWWTPSERMSQMEWLRDGDPLRQIRAYHVAVSYVRDDDYSGYRLDLFDFSWLDWFRAVAKQAEVGIEDLQKIVIRLGHMDYALTLHIESAVQEEAARLRLEITKELLASEFALGDGVRVTWASATIEQHEKRAEMTLRNADANAQDASRHLAAVNLLRERGVDTLAEVDDA